MIYKEKLMQLNVATILDEEVDATIEEMFTYKPWDDDQIESGKAVVEALMAAMRVIISNVPPSPDRSVAIRKIREARMDCNSAIAHKGRF